MSWFAATVEGDRARKVHGTRRARVVIPAHEAAGGSAKGGGVVAMSAGVDRDRWRLTVIATALITAAVTGSATAQPAAARYLAACLPDPPLSWPVRAAFYYPWWPDKWGDIGPRAVGVRGTPSLPDLDGDGVADLYSVDSDTVVDRQIAAMQWGHIDAGIVSWWGVGSVEDRRLERLLARGSLVGFKWCIYHEVEGRRDPDPAELAADVIHVLDRHARNPAYALAYLTVCGRPVVFVYNPRDGCDVVERWRATSDIVRMARGVRPYVVLHEFRDFERCGGAAEVSWHRYCPARGRGALRLGDWSFTIRPGFSSRDEPGMQARRLSKWRRSVAAMAASPTAWHLVTTFNEWLEGTAVEPAVDWPSPGGIGAYLDALHERP